MENGDGDCGLKMIVRRKSHVIRYTETAEKKQVVKAEDPPGTWNANHLLRVLLSMHLHEWVYIYTAHKFIR